MKNETEKLVSGCSPTTCYASFWGKILRKWDWWIYYQAYKTLRRMTLDNPGFSYLLELHIRGWNEQMKISPELKRATEAFHASMRDHRHNVQVEGPAGSATSPKPTNSPL